MLCSKAFEKSEYYIISAHKDNYLHLTDLHTNLDASSFFLRSVPAIISMFSEGTSVEEDSEKNRIRCSR